MKFNPLTRRMFLRGAGGALLLPLLPSLLPREARAAAATKAQRFVMFTGYYGCGGAQFYPTSTQLTNVTTTADGFKTKKLKDITGPVSYVVGSEFDNFRDKITLVRGLSVSAKTTLIHNGSFPSCGSGPAGKGDRSAPVFPYSVDAILSQSSKIYPSAVGIERHVNISGTNFSWTSINGKTQRMPAITETNALMARFSAVVGAGADTTVTTRQQDVVTAVYDDYKRVRDSDKISTADKQRLEAYMNLINETQQGLAAGPRACGTPTMKAEVAPYTTEDERLTYSRNRLNILASMLACGLTRVSAFSLGGGTGDGSGNVHEDSHDNKLTVMGNYHRANGSNVAYFMKLLSDIDDADGSPLLDNTLIFWGNEYGETLYRSPHQALDQNVFIAGGAGGRLRMGEYIDFATGTALPPEKGNLRRGLQRRAYNNFLVTMLNSMGLASSDYERDGLLGFGEYDAERIAAYSLNPWTDTSAARRSALPYLYTGPQMG